MKILKFSAEWCGPCKSLAQTLSSELAAKVNIQEIDIDKDPEKLARSFVVRGVPTLIAVNETGSEISRKVGNLSLQQFNEWIQSLTKETE